MTNARTDAPFRVLVPIDESPLSQQALAFAATLTGKGDEVLLFHVAPSPKPPTAFRGVGIGQLGQPLLTAATPNPSLAERQWDLPMTDQDLAKIENDARKVTANALAIWKSILPNVSQHVSFGDPAREILRVAEEQSVDLIAMATNERTLVGQWLHTSVAGVVARRSPVPVMIVRRQDVEVGFGVAPIHRVIVPLDGSSLSENALPIAGRLARRIARPVQMIHVEPDTLSASIAFGAVLADVAARDAAIAAERSAMLLLEAATARLEEMGVVADWSIDVGEPVERICEIARHGDLIVLASHARSGLDRLIMGSVAEQLVRHAAAPVLIVHAPAAPDTTPKREPLFVTR